MPSPYPDLCSLRNAMRRIEGFSLTRGAASGSDAGAQSFQDNDAAQRVPLGSDPLDGILGGGLRPGSLHEVVAETARDEAAASGFAVALAGLVARGRTLVWILDDRTAWEVGLPYRPGLAAHGIEADKLILVKTKDTATTLWATEEALRAGAPVVLTELWRARSYDLAVSRRLLLAARRRGRHESGGACRAAPARSVERRGDALCGRGRPERPPLLSRCRDTPIPGAAGFAVRLVKWRGDPDSRFGFDRDQVHHLAWDRSGRRFGRPSDLSRLSGRPRTEAVPRGDAA